MVTNLKARRLSVPVSPPFSLMVWHFHGVYLATGEQGQPGEC